MDSEGASLLTLRDAARKFHVETEIRRYEPQDVEGIPLPAIVQFKSYGSSITAHHFNLVYKVDSEKIYMLDGTSGLKATCFRSRLPEWWTGYTMVLKHPTNRFVSQSNLWRLAGWLVVIDLLVLGALQVRRKRWRHSREYAELEVPS